ncbi:MAG TPA: hypothetical protein VEW93_13520 [Acidimicrobiales bacterium]|nr:hypothetical protein [Acidimicrobiales bacterium]
MLALTAFVLVLAVLVLVALFALMDQYRTLELVREHLGINDTPQPLPHPDPAPRPSEAGLPAELDTAGHLVLLFLSTTCGTCKTVATALRGKPTAHLHVVLKAHSPAVGAEWCRETGLPPERVTLDVTSSVADAYQLRTTPAAYVLDRGQVLLAQTIPSFRQLAPLLTPGATVLPRPPTPVTAGPQPSPGSP